MTTALWLLGTSIAWCVGYYCGKHAVYYAVFKRIDSGKVEELVTHLRKAAKEMGR